ncbi:MAG TPA: glycosyltransferase, partial [Acidobacteriaceae bacterium]|nr:glycosyltransferase [Acidobacteriaceae bacterium]
MIVKNEAPVIVRCLESVRPLVDYFLICDTGSTDGTQEIIRGYLRRQELAGEVVEELWHDFATNRSSALQRLRLRSELDYALMMDADDVLAYDPGFDAQACKRSLWADTYTISIRLGPIHYHRPQICSNRLAFRYRGVLHEFLEGPASHPPSSAVLSGLSIVCARDGSRSQVADKYIRDAAVLERALTTEQDPLLISRYTFYLAQSYRDAGELARALPVYLQRAQQGYWEEERYISLYEAAKLSMSLGRSAHEVVGHFMDAHEICPIRAEALHGAMRYCRTAARYQQGYLLGRHALSIPRPTSGLFLEDWIYSYGLFDEFSILAFWTGHY